MDIHGTYMGHTWDILRYNNAIMFGIIIFLINGMLGTWFKIDGIPHITLPLTLICVSMIAKIENININSLNSRY